VKRFAATALSVLYAQAAWADCDELKRQAEPKMAALTEVANRYRATGALEAKFKLLGRDYFPPVNVVSEWVSEADKMLAAMDNYLIYANAVKGCWGPATESAQSMVIVVFKSQRDDLLKEQKGFSEYIAKMSKRDEAPH
jgi:hypothetical protein